MALGERQAEEFLSVLAFERPWRSRDLDAVVANLAPDVELASAAPCGSAPRANQRPQRAATQVQPDPDQRPQVDGEQQRRQQGRVDP